MNRIVRSIPLVPKKTLNLGGTRNMGSHGGPPPTGLEAKIRHYLPNDEHVVMATVGAYFGVYLLFKLKPSKKVEQVATEASSSTSTSTVIPSLFDDSFDEWSKVDGNLAKWEGSLETLGN